MRDHSSKNRSIRLTLLTICLLCPALAWGDSELFRPNVHPSINISPAIGQIVIDGDLTDSGWRDATKAGNFCENSPGDQVKPPVRTEVLVTYDQDNLYLAFIAHDDPDRVRVGLRNRDDIWQDDYLGAMIDTYADQAWCYEFFTNPLGIQGELRMNGDGNEDLSFNLIWQSEGRLTDTGYQVEIAIPFSSLRFPDQDVQVWRINFWRNRPRDFRETSSWAAIERDDPCFLCQFGTLRGIKGVRPGNRLELLPSLVTRQVGSLPETYAPFVDLEMDSPTAEFGIGAQYSLGPNLSFEVSYNPDFSQVESDASQISVNNTYAINYPERRPFFQRGSNLLGTWINAIQTRSINNPLVVTKFSGRLGKTEMLLLSGWDENTPFVLPFEEGNYRVMGGKSLSNILRAKHNFNGGAHLGVLLTDRRHDGGGAGTVAGLDSRLRFGSFQVEWQALTSHTEEPGDQDLTEELTVDIFDDAGHTAAFDWETFWGHAIYGSLERHGRIWSMDFDYNQYSPTFRSDNGYIFSNNRRSVDLWSGWNFQKDSRLVESIFPSCEVGRLWNMDGERKDEWLRAACDLNLTKQTRVSFNQMWSNEVFEGTLFKGIRRTTVMVNSNFSAPLQVGTRIGYARTIRRTATPFLGKQMELGCWGTIKPTSRLVIVPDLNYVKMNHPDDDGLVFQQWILRGNFNYQFTRRLFLRLVCEYADVTVPSEIGERDIRENDLAIEPLISYKVNPFTVFYAGSVHNRHEVEYYMDDGTHVDIGWRERGRQYFLKFQYLFQV
jgi:hypothetical protein